MKTVLIVLVVLVVLVAVLGLLLGSRRRARSNHLQERFGGEYDRTVGTSGDRKAAERELADRERRHDKLQLRELTPEVRERYLTAWTAVQARFVDDPIGAVQEADRLTGDVMRERGYPAESIADPERRSADLSVEHADVLDHYRAGHDIGDNAGQATTEELRRGMHHYRELFDSLLDTGAGARPGGEAAPGRHERADEQVEGTER